MSKRHRNGDEVLFSLDSFLDIVTNVVGVLVLVAIVTVLSAGNISVPSGATAAAAPKVSGERLLFECAGNEVFFVDEEGNGRRLVEEFGQGDRPSTSREDVVTLLDAKDVGDATHRVQAEVLPSGMAWVYKLRSGAHGERAADLDRPRSTFQKKLAGLERGGFAYFVVHDDSFEIFRKARDIARARGVSVGWHPVEGETPVRLSTIGSLGKRIQ
jgi:hypothetical protein